MDVWTDRLLLHGLDRAEAGRIVGGVHESDGPWDAWDPEYPWPDEVDLLRSLAEGAEPHPVFGLYQLRLRDDGRAIGGIGFFGPPGDDGEVEIGYGLVPSVRGRRLAGEAVTAVLGLASVRGVRAVRAETEPGNVVSRRVLERAGFVLVREAVDELTFRRDLVV